MQTTPQAHPDGDYAIVEQLGHQTIVGRVAEVDRFGARFLQIEPIWENGLLQPILVGGGSIYRFTACPADVAFRRQAIEIYQLPAAVRELIPVPALPAPEVIDFEVEGDEIDTLLGLYQKGGSCADFKISPGMLTVLLEKGLVEITTPEGDSADPSPLSQATLTRAGRDALDDYIPF